MKAARRLQVYTGRGDADWETAVLTPRQRRRYAKKLALQVHREALGHAQADCSNPSVPRGRYGSPRRRREWLASEAEAEAIRVAERLARRRAALVGAS